jgi:hypothetical protein
MRRSEWKKEPALNFSETSVGTPQFSVSKDSNFRNYNENTGRPLPAEPGAYRDSLQPAPKKPDLKILPKPSESKSEVIHGVLSLRNLFEETVNKIRKQYLAKERKLFEQLREEEINVLLATRPAILEIPTKISPSPIVSPEPRFIDEYRTSHLLKSYKKGEEDWGNLSKAEKGTPQKGESSSKEKKRISEMVNRKKNELTLELESKLVDKVEESREIIDEYWKDKIRELEEKLAELEKEEEFDWEGERENLRIELEEESEKKYLEQYLQRRSMIKPTNVNKKERENNIVKFQAEVEIELMQMLEDEKMRWKTEEIIAVQEECKVKYKEEQEQLLARKEKEIKRQAELEKQDLMNRLIRDTNEAVEEKLSRMDEDKEVREAEINEILKEECMAELLLESEAKYREIARERIQIALERDSRKNLAHRIEMELKVRQEDLVYQEFNQSFEDTHEQYRKKLEHEHVSNMIELESSLEANRTEEIAKAVEKRFSKTEKDLKINYLKKLDKLKIDLRSEFEEIYIGQIKKLRAILIQEKSLAARIKSQINVEIKNTTHEKNSQLKDLQDKEDLLDRKIRDLSIRQQYEIERSQQRFTPDNSKSPIRNQSSIYSPSPLIPDTEISKNIPKPLPPPALASAVEEVKRRSVSPERRLLKNYDTKEIVAQLIMKNYEDAHKQAWITLKETEEPVARPKSNYAEYTEILSTGKSVSLRDTPKKHSLYNELLKKKYGVIEPRNNYK